MNGEIQLITGCMFSGKSTELMRRVRMHRVAQQQCLIITFDEDVRYGRSGLVSSHDREHMDAIPSGRSLGMIDTNGYDVVAIDEGQFFEDLIEFCETNANEGRIVIVAALDGTYERKPFGRIPELMSLCESVDKLSAVCKSCFGKAVFSERIGTSTSVKDLGGIEKYRAVCRKCWGGGRLVKTNGL